MPNTIEAQGVTVDEAIQIALNQLGVGRDSVEIKILHHPRSGFLGIGARRAKVRATLREDTFKDGAEFDMGAGERRGRRRRRRPQRGGRAGQRGSERDGQAGPGEQQSPREPKPQAEGRRDGQAQRSSGQREQDKDRERGRGGRRSGRGRGGRGRGEQGAAKGERGQTQGSESGAAKRQQRGDARQHDPVRPSAKEPEAQLGPDRAKTEPASAEARQAVTAPKPPATVEEDQSAPRLPLADVKLRSQEIVTDVLRLMGFDAQVVADEDTACDEVVVRVTADAEGLLIGRRGQTLDALEHLVNRAVAPREAAESRVVIDVGGYRERRRESLVELAARLRERAMREQRRVQVSPMSPRDRKIFQGAFEGDEQVCARSLGTGFYRRVLIQPADMDEGASGSEAKRADDAAPTQADSEPVADVAKEPTD